MDWLSYVMQVNWLAVVFRVGGHVIHNGFAGRPAAVTLIDSGHDVLAVTAAGAIIGAMP